MVTKILVYSFLSMSLLVSAVSSPQARPFSTSKGPLNSQLTYSQDASGLKVQHNEGYGAVAPGATQRVEQSVPRRHGWFGKMFGGSAYTDVTSKFTLATELVNKILGFVKVFRFNDNPMVGYITFAGRKIGNIALGRPEAKVEANQQLIGHIDGYNVYIKTMGLGGWAARLKNWWDKHRFGKQGTSFKASESLRDSLAKYGLVQSK